MASGILLVTHVGVAHALMDAARHVMGRLPPELDSVEIAADADPEQALREAAAHAAGLDHGEGVLVLSDLYGATPCNIAARLGEQSAHLRWVAGLNLSMLLRVLNYADKPLDDLARIAVSGGHTGIRTDHAGR